jgi:phosphoesterase RecJ-like protein
LWEYLIVPDIFVQKLDSFNRILITPHEQPDADGIGSTLALAWHLHGLGKEFKLIVSPGMPSYLKFLDTKEWIECFDPTAHADIAGWPDCWVLADANELNRLGPLKDSFLASKAAKLCIDHHLSEGDIKAFDYVLSNPCASSTCELVLDALKFSADMPLEMTQSLFAGIVDDTGGFRFPCTTPQVMKMAAALLESGVKPDYVNRGLYNQGRPAKMRIAGLATKHMHLYCDDRLATMTASLADMESVGAIHEDLEGLVNKPMELGSVEVSVLAYEKYAGCVKVSMRSKSSVDVNAVCRKFGGGGHRLASGVTLSGTVESALEAIVPAIIAEIEQDIES